MTRDTESLRVLSRVVIDTVFFVISGIGIYATKYLWQPFRRGFFCGDESLMYPYRDDTVSTAMLHSVGMSVPCIVLIICEYVVLRSQRDDRRCLGVRLPAWLRGAYGALVSFCLGVAFTELTTNIAKNTIGRPRPHFFDLCRPSVNCSSSEWRGRYIQHDEFTCLGAHREMFKEMGLSFPSGHSAWAAYTMVYLVLYLERRLARRVARALRHALQFSALMLSWFTALSRVSDYKHHWSDVLAGYFLGLTVGLLMWTCGTDVTEEKNNKCRLDPIRPPVDHETNG